MTFSANYMIGGKWMHMAEMVRDRAVHLFREQRERKERVDEGTVASGRSRVFAGSGMGVVVLLDVECGCG